MLGKTRKKRGKGEDTRSPKRHGAEKGRRTQGGSLYSEASQPEKKLGCQQSTKVDPGKRPRSAATKERGAQWHGRLEAGTLGSGQRPPSWETRNRQHEKERLPVVRRKESESPARPPGPTDTKTQSVSESGGHQGRNGRRVDRRQSDGCGDPTEGR